MAQRGGRLKNQLIDDNFIDVIVEGKKFSQHKCNHCDRQTSKLAFKAQHHLKTCQSFINHQKEIKKEKKKIAEIKSKQKFITSMIRFISPVQIAQLHRANVMAVYMTNIPFNYFENSYVIEFFRLLHAGYKSFNRNLLAERLLNETYKAIKLQVMQRLNVCNHLNFFIDETINIRKERIINLCCHVFSDKGFHLKAVAELIEKINAATQTE